MQSIYHYYRVCFLIITCLPAFSSSVFAQTQFAKYLNRGSFSYVRTSLGYYATQNDDRTIYSFGSTVSYPNGGGLDYWVLKFNEYGDTLWTKKFNRNYTDYGAAATKNI